MLSSMGGKFGKFLQHGLTLQNYNKILLQWEKELIHFCWIRTRCGQKTCIKLYNRQLSMENINPFLFGFKGQSEIHFIQ